jgi:hypothetical protein
MRCRPGTSSIRSSIALHDKIDLEVATVFGAAHRLNSIQTLLGEENAVETKTMGKVVVTAKIENLKDLFEVERGSLNNDQVRRKEWSRLWDFRPCACVTPADWAAISCFRSLARFV